MFQQILTLFLFCACSVPVFSQGISLYNPSFEGVPQAGKAPVGWLDCGFKRETPPDTQPDPTFSVNHPPFRGKTYLGMVARDNNTWERVGQKLGQPLKVGQCYAVRFALARSENYYSVSRLTNQPANFNQPLRLFIWGGNDECSPEELLAVSEPIEQTRWKEYGFLLRPEKMEYNYLFLEAQYGRSGDKPYNGNLLVDAGSAILPLEECVLPQDWPGENPGDTLNADFYLEEENINFTLENDFEDRIQFLCQQLALIKFDSTGSLIKDSVLVDLTNRKPISTPVHKIVEMQNLPGTYLLVILVTDPDRKKMRRKVDSIEKQIAQLGVFPNRIVVRKRYQNDYAPQWHCRLANGIWAYLFHL